MEILTSLLNNQFVQAILIGGAAWVYHKARGDKHANMLDGLDGLLQQEIARILQDPTAADKARERLTAAAWDGLARLGVKRSKAIEPFVNTAIEAALGDLMHKLIPIQLGALQKQGRAVLDTLNTPMPQPDPLDHIDVEIVK